MTPLCTSCFGEGFQAVLQKSVDKKKTIKMLFPFSAGFNKWLFILLALPYPIGIECVHVGDHTILCRRTAVATLTGGVQQQCFSGSFFSYRWYTFKSKGNINIHQTLIQSTSLQKLSSLESFTEYNSPFLGGRHIICCGCKNACVKRILQNKYKLVEVSCT